MKESITRKQLRCLRRGAFNCRIGDNTDVWQNNWFIGNPFNRPLKELKFTRKLAYPLWRTMVCKTKGKVFEMWLCSLDKNSASDFRIITIDGIVAYITKSAIYAPASAAWETLTECYGHGYPYDIGEPYWITSVPTFEYWYTWNLNDSRKVDRPVRMITNQSFNLEEKLDKLYYHY